MMHDISTTEYDSHVEHKQHFHTFHGIQHRAYVRKQYNYFKLFFFDKFSNFPFITFIVKVILSHGAKQQLITILHTRHIKRDEKIGLICTNNPKVFEIISVIYLMVSC